MEIKKITVIEDSDVKGASAKNLYNELKQLIKDWCHKKIRNIRLRRYTSDDSILSSVDSVAFNQEELSALVDKGEKTIYLCGDAFSIPENSCDTLFVGVNKAKVTFDGIAAESMNFTNVSLDITPYVEGHADFMDIFEKNMDLGIKLLKEACTEADEFTGKFANKLLNKIKNPQTLIMFVGIDGGIVANLFLERLKASDVHRIKMEYINTSDFKGVSQMSFEKDERIHKLWLETDEFLGGDMAKGIALTEKTAEKHMDEIIDDAKEFDRVIIFMNGGDYVAAGAGCSIAKNVKKNGLPLIVMMKMPVVSSLYEGGGIEDERVAISEKTQKDLLRYKICLNGISFHYEYDEAKEERNYSLEETMMNDFIVGHIQDLLHKDLLDFKEAQGLRNLASQLLGYVYLNFDFLEFRIEHKKTYTDVHV